MEIATTILATFKLRVAILSEWASVKFVCLHFVCLRSWIDRIAADTATITNVQTGKKKLLIANVNISTCSLSSVEISPTIVLFLTGEKVLPNLLTTYRGLELNVRMAKIQTMITPTRLGLAIYLTYTKIEMKHI